MYGTAGLKDAGARNRAVGQVLVAGGLITPEQCDWLVKDGELTLERIEDAVVYRCLVNEGDLLKFLAAHYRTRYVSTERLSKAGVDRSTLALIPKKVADTFGVFPVMFDPKAAAGTGSLSVVTAEPDDAGILKEIQLTSSAREIKAFLARPAAVRAAIARYYGGDTHAFTLLLQAAQAPPRPVSAVNANPQAARDKERSEREQRQREHDRERDSVVVERDQVSGATPGGSYAWPVPLDPAIGGRTSVVPTPPTGYPSPLARDAAASASMRAAPPNPATSSPRSMPANPPGGAMRPAAPPTPRNAPPAPDSSKPVLPNRMAAPPPLPRTDPNPLSVRTTPMSFNPGYPNQSPNSAAKSGAGQAPPTPRRLEPRPLPAPLPEPPARKPLAPSRASEPAAPLDSPAKTKAAKSGSSGRDKRITSMPPRPSSPPAAAPSTDINPDAIAELVNVLVSLLDASRPDLHGHSSLVSRLARRLAERLTLPPEEVAAITLAAQLHDLGKAGPVHLTPISVSEYEATRSAAQQALMTPTRLLGSANIPALALQAIEQMYERYDGKGIPAGVAGKEISIGGRILAVADAYADLIENAGNGYRRQLSPNEACTALTQFKDAVFDPDLVDVFKSIMLGDDVRAKILKNRHRTLLVDPDVEETTVLELRLTEQDFEVRTVRSSSQAARALTDGEYDLVVSELDLGTSDGLALLKDVRGSRAGQHLPWVIYTRRVSREDAQRAFELGVLDFVAKPAQPDVLVAKLKAMLEQRAAKKAVSGVSGSLREMGLPDIVQVLSQGRKTGSLRLTAANGEQGEIHFDAGAVVDAAWQSLNGNVAFYELVKLDEGEFAFDPQFRPGERRIQQSTEALLLEGLRRMDEARSQ